MIARYTRPELGRLWTDEARMENWRRVEIAASEELGDSHFEGGFQHATSTTPPCNVELCLVFDDVASAYERAVAAGASPLAAPEVKPWGQTVAYVRDAFGTLVELASPIG